MTDIQMVRLGDLAPDPVAIRGQEKRLENLDDLLASIPAKGLLQSLRVRPWDPARVVEAEGGKGRGKKGRKTEAELPAPLYGVIAGNRRLATLRKIYAEGGAILGEIVTAEFQVPVILGDENDADAWEITSAENLQRLPLTPVEEFRAYQKMAAAASIKSIAAQFAVPEKRVRQRLKLAELHPDVLAALAAGKLSMAAAEAFTLAEPARQAAYLNKAQDYQLHENNVRHAFTETLVRSDSAVAKVIGKKAYVDAGGQILTDQFASVSYWISPEIIDSLLEAGWAEKKATWLAEGWSFVETVDAFGGQSAVWQAHQIHAAHGPLEAESAKERDELVAQAKALEAKHPQLDLDHDWADDEEDDESAEFAAAEEAYNQARNRIDVLEETAPLAYTAEQKAGAGVVFWPDGRRPPEFGIVRSGTKEAGGSSGGKPSKPPATLAAPGDARMIDLSRQVTEALQLKVSGQAALSLPLLVAGLHARAMHDYTVPVKLSTEGSFHQPLAWEVGGAPLVVTLERGKTFAEALAWAKGQEAETLLVCLAELLGANLNVHRMTGSFGANERAIIDFVDPAFPAFDAEAYFAGVSKPVVIEAWDEMHLAINHLRHQVILAGSEIDLPPFNPAGRKGDMAAAAAAGARATGWLPPQLRTPGYHGPKPEPAEAEHAPLLEAAE